MESSSIHSAVRGRLLPLTATFRIRRTSAAASARQVTIDMVIMYPMTVYFRLQIENTCISNKLQSGHGNIGTNLTKDITLISGDFQQSGVDGIQLLQNSLFGAGGKGRCRDLDFFPFGAEQQPPRHAAQGSDARQKLVDRLDDVDLKEPKEQYQGVAEKKDGVHTRMHQHIPVQLNRVPAQEPYDQQDKEGQGQIEAGFCFYFEEHPGGWLRLGWGQTEETHQGQPGSHTHGRIHGPPAERVKALIPFQNKAIQLEYDQNVKQHDQGFGVDEKLEVGIRAPPRSNLGVQQYRASHVGDAKNQVGKEDTVPAGKTCGIQFEGCEGRAQNRHYLKKQDQRGSRHQNCLKPDSNTSYRVNFPLSLWLADHGAGIAHRERDVDPSGTRRRQTRESDHCKEHELFHGVRFPFQLLTYDSKLSTILAVTLPS